MIHDPQQTKHRARPSRVLPLPGPGTEQAHAHVSVVPGQLWVTLTGEFDVSTASVNSDALMPSARRGPVASGDRVMIELGATSFMDTSAVRVLGTCCDALRASGWQVSLTAPTGETRLILEYAFAWGWLSTQVHSPSPMSGLTLFGTQE